MSSDWQRRNSWSRRLAVRGLNLLWARDTERLAILVEAIGEVKTHELLYVYGGEELYVPLCCKALIQLRNHRFYQEFVKLRDIDKESGLMAMTKLYPKYGILHERDIRLSMK